ncbi:YndJ family transporter [Actinoplanes sp. TRM 88003]|uniref:YndJ family transporter n=1 Tax=Paractinoplanes aksuensis TaxID=2939490 RepID=A0ABT1DI36_9ACTN|nr:YndJ family transporter [Actinoplanes aksuensis]
MVALPAVVALMLPRGVLAGLLCLPYLVACLGVPVLLRRERLVAFAAACLPVAAAGLAAERAGVALLGFAAGVLGLTAAHFHVAGFGALLLLALAKARYRLLAPVGVAVVGIGFLIGGTPGDVVELVGAGVLTAGLWLALATHAGRGARRLFALSLVTMALALLYAAGQVTDIPHLGLTWMVLTHGVLNAAAVLTALVVAWATRDQSWSQHTWSHRIGTGRDRFEAASTALLTWDMHRRSGAWVDPATPPATPGLRMLSSLGFGRLRVPEPCVVDEVVRQSDRTTMHYVALPGHTFAGDESFSVLLAPDGAVRFEVTVRSQPVLLIARLAGPLVPVAQRLFIARCAAALRSAEPATVVPPELSRTSAS